MRTGCIYMGTINNKSYIGYSVDFKIRQKQHLKADREFLFHRAIRRYGAENVEWQILEDDIEEHRLPDREQLWIAFYNTYYDGYNMNEGGGVSATTNPEVAARQAATLRAKAAKGEHNMQDPEVVARHQAALQATIERGEHKSQTPEFRAEKSDIMNRRVKEGTDPMSDPEVKARMTQTKREQAAKGELYCQSPEGREKNRIGQHKRHARENYKNQKEAGQQFIFELEEVE